MAFLHHLPHRPSCVVSGLPPRFRESLERNLKGSVALTTCSVQDLEASVRSRGASIAVVGLTADSLEVAERISHQPGPVKVFLARYRSSPCQPTPVNGFAGVFDLRQESERLAETILAYVLARPAPAAARPPKAGRLSLIARFVMMQKRLANKTAVFEMMLEGFLESAEADEGILLIPEEGSANRFSIVAAQGEHAPEFEHSILLSPACLPSLRQGVNLAGANPIEMVSADPAFRPLYTCAVPIVVGEQLAGCLFFLPRGEGAGMEEYLESARFIFEQLDRRQEALRVQRILTKARLLLSPGHLIMDEKGKVFHQEGTGASLLPVGQGRISGRLSDAIARGVRGESGDLAVRGLNVRYEGFAAGNEKFCLLQLLPNCPDRAEPPDSGAPDQEGPDIFTRLRLSPELEDHLQNVRKGEIDLRALDAQGIRFTSSSAPIPEELAARIFPVLIATRHASAKVISTTFTHHAGGWALKVEAAEEALDSETPGWAHHETIRAAIQGVGFRQASFTSCRFGFQLEQRL